MLIILYVSVERFGKALINFSAQSVIKKVGIATTSSSSSNAAVSKRVSVTDVMAESIIVRLPSLKHKLPHLTYMMLPTLSIFPNSSHTNISS